MNEYSGKVHAHGHSSPEPPRQVSQAVASLAGLCLLLTTCTCRGHSYLEDVAEHLRSQEGLSLDPYQDRHGVWTVGYGHTEGVGPGTPRITRHRAEELLKLDIEEATDRASWHECWVDSNDVRKGVLVNLSFNLGNGLWKFKEFTEYCARGDWLHSAFELIDSDYARQVGGRATFLAAAWALGEWPEDDDGDYKI